MQLNLPSFISTPTPGAPLPNSSAGAGATPAGGDDFLAVLTGATSAADAAAPNDSAVSAAPSGAANDNGDGDTAFPRASLFAAPANLNGPAAQSNPADAAQLATANGLDPAFAPVVTAGQFNPAGLVSNPRFFSIPPKATGVTSADGDSAERPLDAGTSKPANTAPAGADVSLLNGVAAVVVAPTTPLVPVATAGAATTAADSATDVPASPGVFTATAAKFGKMATRSANVPVPSFRISSAAQLTGLSPVATGTANAGITAQSKAAASTGNTVDPEAASPGATPQPADMPVVPGPPLATGSAELTATSNSLVAVDAKTDAKTFVITPNASPQAVPDAAGPGVPQPGNSIEADAPAVKLRLDGVGTAPSNATVAAPVPKAVESSVSGTAIPSDSDALTPPVVQPFTVGVPAAGTVAGAVNQSPTGPAFAAYSAAEKIAVVSPGIADVSTMRKAGAIKTVLAADGKSVTASSPRIGIDVATGSPAMPSGSLLDHATDHVAPTAPVAAEVRSDPSLPQMVALPSTAHRAVEAVLSAAERFAARDQHSVNLQFSVGGSDLNVRVELRGNEVHTTFRTDSADLRAALASEWRAVSGSEERSTKLATPVFTTSSGSNDSFSGDESRRQPAAGRDQQPAAWFSGNRAGSGSTATNNSSAAASATTTVAVNSRHLHTLA